MKKARLFLLFIVVLAGFLRFWQLGKNPPALSWDEAAWGYNAYSLGSTGRDEFGRFLPLNYLESFGDFKPPVYAYLTILPVKIFGLNEFSTRFASAFLGTLTVFLTYFLVLELFWQHQKKQQWALVTAALLAISPWHLMLSRAAFEANVASFFIIAGVFCFLRGVRCQGWWLVLAAISFVLSLQTFNTARVFVPLLLLFLAVAFRRQWWQRQRWTIAAVLVAFLLLLPAVSFFLTPQARLRFKEVNIFSEVGVVAIANQEVENDNFAWWSRIIHNRRWGYLRSFLLHYFDHFNPYFLFFTGDGNPKFSTQDVGELYLWELPFLVAGIVFLVRKQPGYWWLVFVWLLLAIMPAATARETPHALRIEAALPTLQILTAFGLLFFWQWTNKKTMLKKFLRLGLITIVILTFVYLQHGYWVHYPAEFSGEWQYGYQPAIEWLKTVEGNYQQVWFTSALGRPHIYFLFYLRFPPEEYWLQAEIIRDSFGFVRVLGFDRYHFFGTEGPRLTAGNLYFDEAKRVPDHASVLKEFPLLNGQPGLVAYERTSEEIEE